MLNDSLWVFESCLLGVSIPQNHMYIPFTTLYSESNPHDTMQSPLFRMRYSQKIKKMAFSPFANRAEYTQ